MTIQPSPARFAGTDALANNMSDAVVLIARILVGVLFLTSGWGKLMNMAGAVGYLTNLGVPGPAAMYWVVMLSELAIGLGLILGVATRYFALFSVVFVIVATAIAHRYWTYPPAAQGAQYAHFTKNLAIMGGGLLLFFIGAGRYSLDGWMRKRG